MGAYKEEQISDRQDKWYCFRGRRAGDLWIYTQTGLLELNTVCFITLIREMATLTDTMIQQAFIVLILYSSIADTMVIKKNKIRNGLCLSGKKEIKYWVKHFKHWARKWLMS